MYSLACSLNIDRLTDGRLIPCPRLNPLKKWSTYRWQSHKHSKLNRRTAQAKAQERIRLVGGLKSPKGSNLG